MNWRYVHSYLIRIDNEGVIMAVPISLAIALFLGPTQLSVAYGMVKSGDGLVPFLAGA